jgi:hypothetical protein
MKLLGEAWYETGGERTYFIDDCDAEHRVSAEDPMYHRREQGVGKIPLADGVDGFFGGAIELHAGEYSVAANGFVPKKSCGSAFGTEKVRHVAEWW